MCIMESNNQQLCIAVGATFTVESLEQPLAFWLQKLEISCHAFKLHSDFSEISVTRGLSPLPLCVLDH